MLADRRSPCSPRSSASTSAASAVLPMPPGPTTAVLRPRRKRSERLCRCAARPKNRAARGGSSRGARGGKGELCGASTCTTIGCGGGLGTARSVEGWLTWSRTGRGASRWSRINARSASQTCASRCRGLAIERWSSSSGTGSSPMPGCAEDGLTIGTIPLTGRVS